MPRSILLAEDNEDDVFFFQAAAKRLGWQHPIHVAPDGREAIALLSRFASGELPGRIGFALLDLKMPFVGGLEVLEWAQARPGLRGVPLCVLSSSEQGADIESAYRLGAVAYLVKPANPDGLKDLLASLESFWLRFNRLPAAPAGEPRAAVRT